MIIALRPYAYYAFGAYKQIPAIQKLLLLFILSGLLGSCSPKIADKPRAQIIQNGNRHLADYHRDSSRKSDQVIRVVYFYGADGEPLPDWEARLNRTLNDVSGFYQQQFLKYGIRINGIPFERKGANIVFHPIKGKHPAQHYQMNSWMEMQKEIVLSTGGDINFETGYVLVICALTDKLGPFKYNIHSPYYGHWGNYLSNRGDCWVSDCEMLDVKQLTNAQQNMQFFESMVTLRNTTVAEFNSWYIGGIAHEMGHMLGLMHDFGGDNELRPDQISLMGEFGSRHYKDYLWNGKPSSTLSAAAVFQLMNHPLFRKQFKIETQDTGTTEVTNNYEFRDSRHHISGSVTLGRPLYGVSVLMRPVNQSEYFSKSFMAPVTNQKFDIDLGFLPQGPYYIGLFLLSESGTINSMNEVIQVGNDYQISKLFSGTHEINLAKFREGIWKDFALKNREEKLDILKAIATPVQPIDIDTFNANRLELANAKWAFAQVGWGKPARNYFSLESPNTLFLDNGGEFFKTGIYAHAPSDYVFNLGGRWKKFTAAAGLRDGVPPGIGVRFMVWGDGKKLYESGTLTTNQREQIAVNIENVKQLSLQAMYTGQDNSQAWSVWLNPVIER